MKHKYLLVLFFIMGSLICYGQMPIGEYTIGGPADDVASSVIVTDDKGYAILGTTYSFGKSGDIYLIKLDSAGNLSWAKTLGGTGNDVGGTVIQTKDKGYAIAAHTDSYAVKATDAYVLKLDSAGNIQWAEGIGGYTVDRAEAIVQTHDGGYAVTGYANSFGSGSADLYLMRFDSAGNLLWTKTVGGNANTDIGYSILENNDKSFIIAGFTACFGAGSSDVYIVELDSAGNLLWTKTIGGIGVDIGTSIIRTADNGFAVSGYSNSFGAGDYDVYVIKMDSAANIKWTRTIGGIGDDEGNSIVQSGDKGFVIGGFTTSFGAGGFDTYIVKLDSAGNLLWTRTMGGSADDWGYSVVQDRDKGFVLTGSTLSYGNGSNDVFIVKLDSNGNTCMASGSGGITGTGDSVGSGGALLKTGGGVTPGGTIDSGGVKITVCTPAGIATVSAPAEVKVFPVPSSGYVTVSLPGSGYSEINLYDELGREVYSKSVEPFTKDLTLNLNLDNLVNGLYIMQIKSAKGILTRKVKIDE